jgi:hypothetical protein
MRPPGVGLGQVVVLERRAVLGALDVPGHQDCSKLLSMDVPVAEYAVRIGTEVDGCVQFLVEVRLFDDLRGGLVKGHLFQGFWFLVRQNPNPVAVALQGNGSRKPANSASDDENI